MSETPRVIRLLSVGLDGQSEVQEQGERVAHLCERDAVDDLHLRNAAATARRGRLLYGLRFARWYRPVAVLLVAAAAAVAWLTGIWGGLLFSPALLAWTCSLVVGPDVSSEW